MKFFKKNDTYIIIILLAVSLAGWFIYDHAAKAKGAEAEIYYYSKLVKTVDLRQHKDETFSIPQNKHVVFHLYPDGSIAFVKSNCPDKICVRTGKISIPGQSAACLPNGIIMKIVSSGPRDKNTPDIVIGN